MQMGWGWWVWCDFEINTISQPQSLPFFNLFFPSSFVCTPHPLYPGLSTRLYFFLMAETTLNVVSKHFGLEEKWLRTSHFYDQVRIRSRKGRKVFLFPPRPSPSIQPVDEAPTFGNIVFHVRHQMLDDLNRDHRIKGKNRFSNQGTSKSYPLNLFHSDFVQTEWIDRSSWGFSWVHFLGAD